MLVKAWRSEDDKAVAEIDNVVQGIKYASIATKADLESQAELGEPIDVECVSALRNFLSVDSRKDPVERPARPIPRLAFARDRLEKFVRDLCNRSVPLRQLSWALPSLQEVALERFILLCCAQSVPVERLEWYARNDPRVSRILLRGSIRDLTARRTAARLSPTGRLVTSNGGRAVDDDVERFLFGDDAPMPDFSGIDILPTVLKLLDTRPSPSQAGMCRRLNRVHRLVAHGAISRADIRRRILVQSGRTDVAQLVLNTSSRLLDLSQGRVDLHEHNGAGQLVRSDALLGMAGLTELATHIDAAPPEPIALDPDGCTDLRSLLILAVAPCADNIDAINMPDAQILYLAETFPQRGSEMRRFDERISADLPALEAGPTDQLALSWLRDDPGRFRETHAPVLLRALDCTGDLAEAAVQLYQDDIVLAGAVWRSSSKVALLKDSTVDATGLLFDGVDSSVVTALTALCRSCKLVSTAQDAPLQPVLENYHGCREETGIVLPSDLVSIAGLLKTALEIGTRTERYVTCSDKDLLSCTTAGGVPLRLFAPHAGQSETLVRWARHRRTRS